VRKNPITENDNGTRLPERVTARKMGEGACVQKRRVSAGGGKGNNGMKSRIADYECIKAPSACELQKALSALHNYYEQTLTLNGGNPGSLQTTD
jgi:hypothetical protein